MNLLEIILEYLEKDAKDRRPFLDSLVRDAGMPRSLIKHIEGCATEAKVTHQGSYREVFGNEDVNVWIVKCFTGIPDPHEDCILHAKSCGKEDCPRKNLPTESDWKDVSVNG